ncbi:ATP-dependent RecD-like DNA helicase [Ihubacter massiliensis]|uniref:ATP-dependent RecD2 DNA helicase n=1 Tax=Hominibacterium faecale TaxID=2839743 RepID=A0A9J6QV67_9FIRM|nr:MULTISPECIES: ATP-dependent RecD-like DNA helicase [Eubacteriales Family XIII. Incertae Sedis]MCO7123315.1 ATP-dependent RecD-like DNA helicase [Ihubacter massiliensis]MCU7379796.1 ATP-dependent RecD-like DNA helicase [Hominibacterium faecale]
MMEEKQGSVAEIIFHNQENGYTIAVFETEEEQFTAVGSLPSCHKGSSYILRGQWKIHPTYGEQFAVSGFEEVMPSTEDGIQEFLASGVLKGIGKKTAAAIVAKFGSETFEIIEKQPQKLTEIDGIGDKKAEAVAEAFRSHREFARITLYLQQFGINADYAMKLYRVYGSDTITAVEENPYRLAEDIFGIGFKKADKIAEKMGIARDDEHRIKSGVKFTLWYFAGEGNTFLPQTVLCEKAGGLLEVESDKINDCLVEMAFQGDVHIENLENRNVVFLMTYYLAEQNVCKCLAAINSAGLKAIGSDLDSLIAVTETESGIALSENQKYAVKTSLNQGISVITGGPGTGKTTIINSIIKILQHSGLKTAIAAPTGRAAKRITETSGYEASTIHRLLEYYYSEGEDTMRFGKTAEDPLDYDAVIIDEASMIDLMLMNGLVSAIKPATRLILVGDADQLPSVGAGNVLRDIINSEYIYCVKLTEIFRQAKESLIVVNAHKINRGEYPDCNEKGKDFFMMRQKSEKDMLNLIKDLCIRRLPAYYTQIMPVRDIQILTPVRKGLLGSINLNRELQDVFNPPCPELEERKAGDRIFREHDKVMQIKNNYQLKWRNQEDFTEGEGVFNGDVGFINSIDREFNEVVVVFDECKYVTYDFSQLDELELAYAVTVHKSQGSEFPIVIMPMSWFPPVLATRNLLYTGVTRGKHAVVLVGSENKMHAMVDNNRITQRYSGLSVRLKALLSF